MSLYNTSTLQTNNITITSIQRIFLAFKNIFIVMFPFALMLALCIRSPIYLSTSDIIGSWTVNQESVPDLNKVGTYHFLLMFLPIFIQYPLFTLMLKVANDVMENKHVAIQQSIIYILVRTPRIIITVLLGILSIGAGMLCFVLPGLYFLAVFSMVLPSIAIDDARFIASFKNSFKLIKGSVMYTLLTIAFITIVPQIILRIIGMQIAALGTITFINEALIVLSLTVLSISLCAGIIFLFDELHIRQREWTLEQAEESDLAETPNDNTPSQA